MLTCSKGTSRAQWKVAQIILILKLKKHPNDYAIKAYGEVDV
jgi:hypothetical protein